MVDGDGEADVVDGRGGGRRGAGILGVGDADDLTVEVKQRTAGVAGVDGAVRLNEVHGQGIGEGDLPILGADKTGGEGEGQLAQRVADGHHAVAHVQVVGVAQNHRGQPLGVHLQDGHVVAFVVADEGRVIGVAVVHGYGDAVGVFHHVVVGQDIAVLGEDEAGTGRGGGGLEAPVVGGDGGGDADGGIDVGGVNLRGGHFLAGVHGDGVQDALFPDALKHGGFVLAHRAGLAAAAFIPDDAACPQSTAQQGEHQRQRADAKPHAVFLFPLLRRGGRVNGNFLRRGFVRVIVIVGIVELFIHNGLLPFMFHCPQNST